MNDGADRTRPARVVEPDDPDDDGGVQTIEAPIEGDEYVARTIKGYKERRLRIEFGGPYRGTWIEVHTNCKRKLIKRLVDSDPDLVDAAFCEFVLNHNFEYEDGTPLPVPLTVEAIEELDNTLYLKTLKLGLEAMQKAAGVTKS